MWIVSRDSYPDMNVDFFDACDAPSAAAVAVSRWEQQDGEYPSLNGQEVEVSVREFGADDAEAEGFTVTGEAVAQYTAHAL